jgi:hypothetical protein
LNVANEEPYPNVQKGKEVLANGIKGTSGYPVSYV